jgi:excisionase family DNA binding protein
MLMNVTESEEMNTNDDRLLRPEEAAQLLGISRSKVHELARLGVLPYVQVGGRRRIPGGALKAWVEANLRPARDPEHARDERDRIDRED